MGNLGFPFRPYHPGELLKEELECRNISQRSFAMKTGMSYTTLNEILNSKRPVTADFALLMEAALGIEPNLLLRMQTSYNMQVAKTDKKLTRRLAEIRNIAASTIL
jgi:addiction module HigA family antidote